MKIEKYVKDKNNIYKVYIDGEVYKLYDDVIVKYHLILKDNIDEETFNKIIKDNNELEAYYLCIKYINKRLRSEKELIEYMKKKEYSTNIIDSTIKKLYENKFINNDIYLKSYISDEINLTNHGPIKIKNSLIKLGLDINDIENKIKEIDYKVWYNKVDNFIEKKIKTNHTNSSYYLKNKLKIELINLGYDKELIESVLSTKNIEDKDAYKKEYEKIKNKLSKKYEGYELENKIKAKLYQKGFKVNSYEE